MADKDDLKMLKLVKHSNSEPLRDIVPLPVDTWIFLHGDGMFWEDQQTHGKLGFAA